MTATVLLVLFISICGSKLEEKTEVKYKGRKTANRQNQMDRKKEKRQKFLGNLKSDGLKVKVKECRVDVKGEERKNLRFNEISRNAMEKEDPSIEACVSTSRPTTSLTLEDCQFVNYSSSDDQPGGAICGGSSPSSLVGTLSLTNVYFVRCRSLHSYGGGAIYCYTGTGNTGNIQIDNCQFESCESSCGGAISLSSRNAGKVVEIKNSIFQSNTATSTSEPSIDGEYNVQHGGGAILLGHQKCELTNCRFSNNRCQYGCNLAVCSKSNGGQKFIIDKCVFSIDDPNSYNSLHFSLETGGKLDVTITNNTFLSNTLRSDQYHISGHPITAFTIGEDNCYNNSDDSAQLYSSEFLSDPSSQSNQITLCKPDPIEPSEDPSIEACVSTSRPTTSLTLEDCQFVNYSSSDDQPGGAIFTGYLPSSTSSTSNVTLALTLNSVIFINCSSFSIYGGGAIFSYIGSQTTKYQINHCQFRNCQSICGGAAVINSRVGEKSVEMSYSLFSSNIAASFNEPIINRGDYCAFNGGGGALLLGLQTATISHCTFLNNTCVYGSNIAIVPTSLAKETQVLLSNSLIEFPKSTGVFSSIYFKIFSKKLLNVHIEGNTFSSNGLSENQYHIDGITEINGTSSFTIGENNCFLNSQDKDQLYSQDFISHYPDQEHQIGSCALWPFLDACNEGEKLTTKQHVAISNCTFANYLDDENPGGAIYLGAIGSSSSTIINWNLSNVYFVNCSCSNGYGGGAINIYISGSDPPASTIVLSIDQCYFEDCQSTCGGACAINSRRGRLGISITNTTFKSNLADSLNLPEYQSTFTAKNGGGALLLGLQTAIISNCTFENNTCVHGSNIAVVSTATTKNPQIPISISNCQFYYPESEEVRSSLYFSQDANRILYVTLAENSFISKGLNENQYHIDGTSITSFNIKDSNCYSNDQDENRLYPQMDGSIGANIGSGAIFSKCSVDDTESSDSDDSSNDDASIDSSNDDTSVDSSNDDTSIDSSNDDASIDSSNDDDKTSNSLFDPSNAAASNNKKDLSGGAIASIVIAVIVAIVILILIILFFIIRKRRLRAQPELEMSEETQSLSLYNSATDRVSNEYENEHIFTDEINDMPFVEDEAEFLV